MASRADGRAEARPSSSSSLQGSVIVPVRRVVVCPAATWMRPVPLPVAPREVARAADDRPYPADPDGVRRALGVGGVPRELDRRGEPVRHERAAVPEPHRPQRATRSASVDDEHRPVDMPEPGDVSGSADRQRPATALDEDGAERHRRICRRGGGERQRRNESTTRERKSEQLHCDPPSVAVVMPATVRPAAPETLQSDPAARRPPRSARSLDRRRRRLGGFRHAERVEWPREESNLRAQVRSLPLYPLSYGA